MFIIINMYCKRQISNFISKKALLLLFLCFFYYYYNLRERERESKIKLGLFIINYYFTI